jgi:hypothetical protein
MEEEEIQKPYPIVGQQLEVKDSDEPKAEEKKTKNTFIKKLLL